MAIDLETSPPASWACVDCGVNTTPGFPSGVEIALRYRTAVALKKLTGGETQPLATLEFGSLTEVYEVRDSVWKAAGMEMFGGCLCIGCLEKRLGRQLRPKDFPRNSPFNKVLGTARLLSRRTYQQDSE